MANVPYDGVATAQPDANVNIPYYQPHVSPDMFGAGIGRGLQEAGAGALKASQFYGQVSTDQSVNNVTDRYNKIFYGDPSKMTPGLDGQMHPDTGFMGLRGQDMMNAYPNVAKQLEQIRQQERANLSTPEAQLQFDQQTRRLSQMRMGEAGRAYEQANKQWATGVNDVTSRQALEDISRDPTNDAAFAGYTENLKTAYVKDSQLKGLGDAGAKDAVARAEQDAWKTRLLTIGADHPDQALSLLQQHKNEVGSLYPTLEQHFKGKGLEAEGAAEGNKLYDGPRATTAAIPSGVGFANPKSPAITQATQAVPGGFSPQGLARTVQIESGGNASAGNGSHLGLTQFSPSTWAAYGQGSRLDPFQSIMAAQRYSADNAKTLAGALGRAPTDAELYLAHQQGPGGAAKLLSHPNERAGDLVGDAAIARNGGNPNAPASAFTQMWAHKFGGASFAPTERGFVEQEHPQKYAMPENLSGARPNTPIQPDATIQPASLTQPAPEETTPIPSAPGLSIEAQKADVQAHLANTLQELYSRGLDPEAERAAERTIKSRAQAEMLGLEAQADLQKENRRQVIDEYQQRIDKHDYGSRNNGRSIYDDIDNDPRLAGPDGFEVKQALHGVIHTRSGLQDTGDFGPEFTRAQKGITAQPGDPDKISDPLQILKMENDGRLTPRGAQELQRELSSVHKEESYGISQTMTQRLSWIKGQMSFDQEANAAGIKIRDPDGERRYANFIPTFYSAFENWQKAGKNPYEFFAEDNIKKLMQPFERTKAQIAQAKLNADAESVGGTVQDQQAQNKAAIAAVPPGVDETKWASVLGAPPPDANGIPLNTSGWANIVNGLLGNPTVDSVRKFIGANPKIEDRIKAINESPMLKAAGVDATKVLLQLTGETPEQYQKSREKRRAEKPAPEPEKPSSFWNIFQGAAGD